MLVIRLQRTGRENLPSYRLVVAEKARPVKGKFLEIVGHYLPARDPKVFEHQDERILHWIGKGAVPSNTAARLLKRAGVSGMDKYIARYTKRTSKNAPEAPVAPPAPAAVTTEAPAAEAPKAEEAPAA